MLVLLKIVIRMLDDTDFREKIRKIPFTGDLDKVIEEFSNAYNWTPKDNRIPIKQTSYLEETLNKV
jgi:hypothetical protein